MRRPGEDASAENVSTGLLLTSPENWTMLTNNLNYIFRSSGFLSPPHLNLQLHFCISHEGDWFFIMYISCKIINMKNEEFIVLKVTPKISKLRQLISEQIRVQFWCLLATLWFWQFCYSNILLNVSVFIFNIWQQNWHFYLCRTPLRCNASIYLSGQKRISFLWLRGIWVARYSGTKSGSQRQ